MSVTALLDRLDSLEARLDAARRRSEVPGQLALDLLGGWAAPFAKKGPGGGELTGYTWFPVQCRGGSVETYAADPSATPPRTGVPHLMPWRLSGDLDRVQPMTELVREVPYLML